MAIDPVGQSEQRGGDAGARPADVRLELALDRLERTLRACEAELQRLRRMEATVSDILADLDELIEDSEDADAADALDAPEHGSAMDERLAAAARPPRPAGGDESCARSGRGTVYA